MVIDPAKTWRFFPVEAYDLWSLFEALNTSSGFFRKTLEACI
jgi:hypothetical protein